MKWKEIKKTFTYVALSATLAAPFMSSAGRLLENQGQKEVNNVAARANAHPEEISDRLEEVEAGEAKINTGRNLQQAGYAISKTLNPLPGDAETLLGMLVIGSAVAFSGVKKSLAVLRRGRD